MPCAASKVKTVGSTFANFPKAQGFLGEIIQAYEGGDLTPEEAAEWLLETALEAPMLEIHTRVKTGYSLHQTKKVTREDDSRAIYQWMVKTKGLQPYTARQYVYRLQAVQAKGGLQDVDRTVCDIQQNPDNWPNWRQTLAVLMLYSEFIRTQ